MTTFLALSLKRGIWGVSLVGNTERENGGLMVFGVGIAKGGEWGLFGVAGRPGVSPMGGLLWGGRPGWRCTWDKRKRQGSVYYG